MGKALEKVSTGPVRKAQADMGIISEHKAVRIHALNRKKVPDEISITEAAGKGGCPNMPQMTTPLQATGILFWLLFPERCKQRGIRPVKE